MLETLRTHFNQIADRLRATERERRFHTTAQDDGAAHCEFVDGVYHYINTERGKEIQHRTTKDQNEVLFWLVSTMTRSIAGTYELEIRPKDTKIDHDTRIVWMDKDVELLRLIDPSWAERRRQDYDRTLEQHPHE